MRHLIIILSIFFLFSSCQSEDNADKYVLVNDSQTKSEITHEIDNICNIAGLKRHGEISESWIKNDRRTSYHGKVEIQVGNKTQEYNFYIDDKSPVYFKPNNFILNLGIGFDTFKKENIRQEILETVKAFANKLNIKYFGKAAIQEFDEGYVVSYYSISEDKIQEIRDKGGILLDPYVTFLLTKEKNIFGLFHGA